MEVELKLLIAREDAARVLDSQAVRSRTRGRRRTSELASIYFDTPDCRLWSQGFALRLRQSKTRWQQTLKSDAANAVRGAAGLHQREEYEWPVAGRRIDFAPLDASPYGAAFARRRVRDNLRPAFSTRFRRTACRVELAQGVEAELCIDLGWIRAGAKREPICEVEIELCAGGSALALFALFTFAKELLQDVPFRLGAVSKAERGYAMALGATPRPHKAGAIALRPDANRAEALLAVARAGLAQVHANEDGFLLDRDPEYLHQLRVGFRRLRVALAIPDDPDWLAAREPLREELRWLFSLLGLVRNWDVFLGEMLPPLARQYGARGGGGEGVGEGIAAFRARCLRLRRRQLALAREAVRGPRYAALLLAIGELLAGPLPAEAPGEAASARAFARAAIERRERTLRKRGAALGEAGPEERHRTRIAAKKLRYCSEFFAALYPHKRVRRYIDALAGLQEVLGVINDAVVCTAMIGKLDAPGGAKAGDDARLIGLVQGWMAAGEARAIGRLREAWDRFAAQEPFWD